MHGGPDVKRSLAKVDFHLRKCGKCDISCDSPERSWSLIHALAAFTFGKGVVHLRLSGSQLRSAFARPPGPFYVCVST